MCIFSSEVYPESSMISILSRSGLSMALRSLHVHRNRTLERSKGVLR